MCINPGRSVYGNPEKCHKYSVFQGTPKNDILSQNSLDWPSNFLQISVSQELKKTVGGLKLAPANQSEVTRNQTANQKTGAIPSNVQQNMLKC